jgi:flagellar hook-length control protein FliK
LPVASLAEEPVINDGLQMPRPPTRVVPAPQRVTAKLGDEPRDFANKFVQQAGPAVTAEPVTEVITTAMPKLGVSVAAATVGVDGSANESGRAAMSIAGQVLGQGGQQNAGHSSGGSNHMFGATSQVSHESIMEMLDMAQDNWAEMLLNRVETSLAGGKEKLEFLLNPRNLGKMKVTLGLQNDRAMVQINTETAAAAALLAESEGRLAQLMESSGLKLGQLNSTQGQPGQGSTTDQHAGGQGNPNSTPGRTTADQQGGDTHQDNGGQTHMSDHLINVQA